MSLKRNRMDIRVFKLFCIFYLGFVHWPFPPTSIWILYIFSLVILVFLLGFIFLINSSNSYNKSCWYGLFSYLLCTIRMTWKKIPNMFFCWLVLWNKVKISLYITWVYAALWTNEMVHNVYFLVRSHSLYNMEMQNELSRRKKT